MMRLANLRLVKSPSIPSATFAKTWTSRSKIDLTCNSTRLSSLQSKATIMLQTDSDQLSHLRNEMLVPIMLLQKQLKDILED